MAMNFLSRMIGSAAELITNVTLQEKLYTAEIYSYTGLTLSDHSSLDEYFMKRLRDLPSRKSSRLGTKTNEEVVCAGVIQGMRVADLHTGPTTRGGRKKKENNRDDNRPLDIAGDHGMTVSDFNAIKMGAWNDIVMNHVLQHLPKQKKLKIMGCFKLTNESIGVGNTDDADLLKRQMIVFPFNAYSHWAYYAVFNASSVDGQETSAL